MMSRIIKILEGIDIKEREKERNVHPTLLYNEGWMLRLVLDWFAMNHEIKCEVLDIEGKTIELSIPNDCKWFSEALLPSPFLRGKEGREGYTHADGVVGKFCIGSLQNSEPVSVDECASKRFCPKNDFAGKNKGKLSLKPDCDFFYVVEAKMGSSLSSGTVNAKGYNQAARSIACISELLAQQKTTFEEINFKLLGFYVFLPEKHPDLKKNSDENKGLNTILRKENIKTAIRKRMDGFEKKSITWLENNLDSFMNKLSINAITWESILDTIKDSSLNKFYDNCKKFNGIKEKPQNLNIGSSPTK